MTFLNVSLGAPVVLKAETTTGGLGAAGARFILDGAASAGRFSLVEYPIVPRGMAAPLHRPSTAWLPAAFASGWLGRGSPLADGG